MLLIKTFFIYFLCLFTLPIFSSDFTSLLPGPRANSLGTAFSSIADDPYAIFYNPAGISQMRDIQVASSLSRIKSIYGDFGELSIGYVRPLPYKENGVFGFGYDAIRRSSIGNKDSFLFGYSDKLTIKYLQMPLLWGANFRIVSIRYPNKTHLGMGIDAGILLRSYNGLRTGIVLSDLDIGLGKSYATLTIGNSYKKNNILYALDLRIRGDYAEFFPGIEYYLYNDLLRIRFGKGSNLYGINFLSLGFGYQLDPINLDFTYSIPYAGYQEKSGLCQIGFTYKFNALSFEKKMVEEATNKLAELNPKIDDLNREKDILEVQIQKYETAKGILESDLTLKQTRYNELTKKIKDLEIEIIDAQFKKENPPKKSKIIEKKEKWPKYHKVVSGDTLRSIASKYYGNPNLWQLIYEENSENIFNGLPKENKIFKIPAPVER